MSLEPVRPSTWSELLEALYAGSWNPILCAFGSLRDFDRDQANVNERVCCSLGWMD